MADTPTYVDEAYPYPNRIKLTAVDAPHGVYDMTRQPGDGTAGTKLNAAFFKGYQDHFEASVTANETARENAETARATAETSRASVEASRVTDETARKTSETSRASAEGARVTAETARKSAESSRVSTETARVTAESARKTAETARASAETSRASAETARVGAESSRASEFTQMMDAAQNLKFTVLSSGQYNASTGEPTVTGTPGVLYLTPDTSGTGDNKYNEWAYIGIAWEEFGPAAPTPVGIPTADIDSVCANGQVAGTKYLNATGLTYLWSKLKGAFAPLLHQHSAADITSGTLPITQGGTGGATASAARQALGAADTAYISSADRWHEAHGNSTITIVPPRDCTLDVCLAFDSTWGWAGNLTHLSINAPAGLTKVAYYTGALLGGDTVGRLLNARLVVSGARAGTSYTFSYTLTVDGDHNTLGNSAQPNWIAHEV